MGNQSFQTLNLKKEELEWLYVPDVKYYEYENCSRYLQLLIPYQHEWKENKKFPLIFFIPGSAWHKQEMYNSLPSISELAKRGFAIAQVQYRESELDIFPAQVIDVKNAIRFIYSIAEQFHMDTDHIFVAGNSSGAHIALLAGLTAASGELDSKETSVLSCKIKGIISYSAQTDLTHSEGTGPCGDLLGTDDVRKVPELAKSASCATYVDKDREIPPILMFHGKKDSIVSVEESRNLFDTLTKYDKVVSYYELENEDHGGPTFWSAPVLDIVEDFVKKNCH